MKARLIKTQGPGLEATLEIEGREYCVMDSFDWARERCPQEGDSFDVSFSWLLDESWSWESMFSANPDRRVGLESLGGWSYLAFGRITSVNPVHVDCGLLVIDDAIYSHDPSLIGEFIGLGISRLDAYAG